jgi:hypothetical protein
LNSYMKLYQMIYKAAILLMIPLAILSVASCFNIKYSSTGATPPGKTFSVQFVENQARLVEPGLSQQFTDALKDYVQSNSSLKMVTGTGDNDFEAVISGYEPSTPATIVAGDVAAQNKFTVTIKVKYICNINPDLDFEASFTRFRMYSAESGFEDVKSDLTTEIIDEILEDIYKRAFVNW